MLPAIEYLKKQFEEMNKESVNYNKQEAMFHGSLNKIMGTRFDAIIIGKSEEVAALIWKNIQQELNRIEKLLNRFNPDSEVAKVNFYASRESVLLSPELWHLIVKCEGYFIKTEKLFDITLKNFLQVVLDREAKSISFMSKDISLDFGGIGKGYALERIEKILKEQDVLSALICFGDSSIYAIRNHPYGDSWKVGISNPFVENDVLAKIQLYNKALSTSGNTPAHTGHIVNTGTGSVLSEKKVVSVIADDSIDAEVLSTAYMIADQKQIERIAQNFEEHKYFIFNL